MISYFLLCMKVITACRLPDKNGVYDWEEL